MCWLVIESHTQWAEMECLTRVGSCETEIHQRAWDISSQTIGVWDSFSHVLLKLPEIAFLNSVNTNNICVVAVCDLCHSAWKCSSFQSDMTTSFTGNLFCWSATNVSKSVENKSTKRLYDHLLTSPQSSSMIVLRVTHSWRCRSLLRSVLTYVLLLLQKSYRRV